MTRRFEFVGGTSAKFYEVVVAGSSVTVRYGRLGTDGQRLTKSLASAVGAQRHAEPPRPFRRRRQRVVA